MRWSNIQFESSDNAQNFSRTSITTQTVLVVRWTLRLLVHRICVHGYKGIYIRLCIQTDVCVVSLITNTITHSSRATFVHLKTDINSRPSKLDLPLDHRRMVHFPSNLQGLLVYVEVQFINALGRTLVCALYLSSLANVHTTNRMAKIHPLCKYVLR